MPATSLSIVIPSFNAAATLPRAILSCVDWVDAAKIFVVLDGPDAESQEAARCVEGVQVIALDQRSGAPACRNAGLARVTTDYVMFLDADDYIVGSFLLDAQRVAQAQAADLVLGRFAFEWPSGRREFREPLDEYGIGDNAVILRRWLLNRYTPPCAVVWNADFVRSLGAWDEALAKNQDGDIIYRALMAGARVAFGERGAGVYVQSDNPGRITRQQSPRALSSQLMVLDRIRSRLDTLPGEVAEPLALAYYGVARHAYTAQVDDLAETAERSARELGLSGEPGELHHTLLASALGLRGKQRLTQKVRSALS